MKLNITERQVDDITFLNLSGDITFGEGSDILRRAIRGLLNDGKKKIYLDLKAVVYVDSSGVGELVSGFTAVKRENGKLKLLNLSSRVRQLLTICKLLTIFDIDEAEKEATIRKVSQQETN